MGGLGGLTSAQPMGFASDVLFASDMFLAAVLSALGRFGLACGRNSLMDTTPNTRPAV